jgi:hypothetical protein
MGEEMTLGINLTGRNSSIPVELADFKGFRLGFTEKE